VAFLARSAVALSGGEKIRQRQDTVKITDQGVPIDNLISTVKASVTRAGVSRSSPTQDLSIASVQLILNVVASSTTGGGLDFCVPFIGMKLSIGTKVTKEDTHTIDITLVPPDQDSIPVRGGEGIEDVLVEAVAAIRAVTSKAAEGNDPWFLADGTIDISFGITQTGNISLGVDGELSGKLTNTLRLKLAAIRQ
jgi:Trypsin-co-occurring domain 2